MDQFDGTQIDIELRITILNSDQLLYGHVLNVDRLIQHMLEQFLNKSTACLTWQNELTFTNSWERDNYVVGTRYYVVGTRYYVVGTR